MARKYEQEARALEATGALVWLFEIEIPTTPPTRVRITTNNEPVSFGTALDGTDRIYSPFPMKIGVIDRQRDGDLPQLTVAVANVKNLVIPYLEQHRGLTGQPAIVQLVSLADLSNVSASLRFDGEIIQADVDADAVSFSVGAYNADGMLFPKNRHVAEHCRHIFGSAGCGYPLNNPLGNFTTCPRTYLACVERGDDEEDVMGILRAHPDRFGGFRGIPNG